MPLHVIKIVRELTDRVPTITTTRQSFCYTQIVRQDVAFWQPKTDIFESDEQVVIKIELAGVDREDVSVKLKDGQLIISGVRKEKRPQQRVYFHQLEISYGPFQKVIFLPETLQHNEIVAQLEEGMLYIIISKKSQSVEIPIQNEVDTSDF